MLPRTDCCHVQFQRDVSSPPKIDGTIHLALITNVISGYKFSILFKKELSKKKLTTIILY